MAEDFETERAAQKALQKIQANKARYELQPMIEQARQEAAQAREYVKVPANSRAGSGGSSGGSSGAEIKMLQNPKAMKKGGKVRGGGIETKGKTKGRMV